MASFQAATDKPSEEKQEKKEENSLWQPNSRREGSLSSLCSSCRGKPQGSALSEPERTAVENVLRHGTVEVFDAGHSVHRENFAGTSGFWAAGFKTRSITTKIA